MKKPKKKQRQQRSPRARVARRREQSADLVNAASRRLTPRPSRSLAPQGVDLLERFDRFATIRNQLRALAGAAGEWAGIPIPFDDQRLVIEPSYPFAEVVSQMGPEREPDPDMEGVRVVNRWFSKRHRTTVAIVEKDGKRMLALGTFNRRFDMDLMTLGCAPAWGIEQEGAAVQTLGRLVRHHPFKSYLLTGMFLETSPRSQITYCFRRLKPTVAISFRTGETKLLAALCMHPIGYYEDSWAGAMCPTDDIIAHLMLMRGDEHMLWKRCYQHPPNRPEAGL